MDNITILLEKYFRGETTLIEEKELKHYFANGNIAHEHRPYSALFEVFELEIQEKLPAPRKKLPAKRNDKRLWIQLASITSIAATLVFVFWLIGSPPTKTDQYAMADRPRNEDTEFAQKYTQEKLEKVNDILSRSLKPMRSFEKIRNGMRPINKISETKEKIQELQNKLQFK